MCNIREGSKETKRKCASDANDCSSCNTALGPGGLVNGALMEIGPDTIFVLETTVTSRSVMDTEDPKCCTGNTSPGHMNDDKFPIANDSGAVGVTMAPSKDVSSFNSA